MKQVFTRFFAGLLAVLLCFSLLSVSAYAAAETADSYSIAFPREGDANADYSGLWGHDALHYRNGWTSGKAEATMTLHSIGSFDGPACYCIEPGVPRSLYRSYEKCDEDFWNSYPSDYNHTIDPGTIKTLIGRILQYGYQGSVSLAWRSQNNADADKMAHMMATQVLVWETVVGERNEDFSYAGTDGADPVKAIYRKTHPLYARFAAYYDEIESQVQQHTVIPSFMTRSTGRAQTVELCWNGSKYAAELTDENGVLENYTFSADGVHCEVQGNQLFLTAREVPVESILLTAEKKSGTRSGIVVWTDGHIGPDGTMQDVVAYAASVSDPVVGFLRLTAQKGVLMLRKTSEDGRIAGISFTVTGDNFCKTAITDANGALQLDELVPGEYTVTENAADFCEPQATQTVTVKAGQTAEVFFANKLKRGTLEVVKTAEDGFVQNVRFRLFGTADCGQSVDEYAETDESGLAVFDRIPIGSAYTLAEVGAPERYVELAPQAVRIAWNAVTRQTVENRLVRGSIRGTKVGKAETPLPGAVFGLFAEETTEFTRGTALRTAESEGSGAFSFADVAFGNYLVRELAAPAGYVLSDEIFEVRIAENGCVIELGTLKNKPAAGVLELTKLDVSTGKPLPNAGFRIRDTAGNGIIEGYTDENGIAKFTLRCGEYTYEEFSVPEGYLLDASPHAFAITEDGQIVRAEMTNERLPQKSETPKTGDASPLALWLGLAAVALGGLVAVILIRAKSHKDDE